jgi:hypothetical protein
MYCIHVRATGILFYFVLSVVKDIENPTQIKKNVIIGKRVFMNACRVRWVGYNQKQYLDQRYHNGRVS